MRDPKRGRSTITLAMSARINIPSARRKRVHQLQGRYRAGTRAPAVRFADVGSGPAGSLALTRLLAQIFVRLGIDADVLADADEQRHLDGQAAGQFGVLENVAALMAR